ncbi:unnamed protein product [Paramecium sonneborni]|uniref:Transmembrane protein n=1 Tax=Paramecium sonneborni TaxID=65129 RepID=A0A8S1RNN3_9CILI|nr:unnamed protein product [Paramecium sonneborni]
MKIILLYLLHSNKKVRNCNVDLILEKFYVMMLNLQEIANQIIIMVYYVGLIIMELLIVINFQLIFMMRVSNYYQIKKTKTNYKINEKIIKFKSTKNVLDSFKIWFCCNILNNKQKILKFSRNSNAENNLLNLLMQN